MQILFLTSNLSDLCVTAVRFEGVCAAAAKQTSSPVENTHQKYLLLNNNIIQHPDDDQHPNPRTQHTFFYLHTNRGGQRVCWVDRARQSGTGRTHTQRYDDVVVAAESHHGSLISTEMNALVRVCVCLPCV